MTIEIDIPDYPEGKDRRRSLLAGMEEVARYEPDDGDTWRKGWYTKIAGCSHCGRCCPDECPHKKLVGKLYWCALGGEMPYCCLASDGSDLGLLRVPGCTIKWRRHGD
jgi:hypothetical protein